MLENCLCFVSRLTRLLSKRMMNTYEEMPPPPEWTRGSPLMPGGAYAFKMWGEFVFDPLISLSFLGHCGHCTFCLEEGREAVPDTVDLRPGLLLMWFELVAYIHKMMSHTLATWSNEQFVNVGKWDISPNPSSLCFGEICIRSSETCQVWMLSFSALNMLIIGNLNRQKDIRKRPVRASKMRPSPWAKSGPGPAAVSSEWFLHF